MRYPDAESPEDAMYTMMSEHVYFWPPMERAIWQEAKRLAVMYEAKKEAASMKLSGWFRGERDRQWLRHLARHATKIQALARRYLARLFFIQYRAMQYQKRQVRMMREEVETKQYLLDLEELNMLHLKVQAAIEGARCAAMRDEDVRAGGGGSR